MTHAVEGLDRRDSYFMTRMQAIKADPTPAQTLIEEYPVRTKTPRYYASDESSILEDLSPLFHDIAVIHKHAHLYVPRSHQPCEITFDLPHSQHNISIEKAFFSI